MHHIVLLLLHQLLLEVAAIRMARHGWLKQLLLLLMMAKVTVNDCARTTTSLKISRTQLLMRLVLHMLLLLLESLIKLSLAYSFSNL